MKTCPVCGIEKPLEAFKKIDKRRPDGFAYRLTCNKCSRRASYLRNRDKIIAKQREINKRVALVPFKERYSEEERRQRAEKKRLERITGHDRHRPAKHDAHVKAWAAWKKEQSKVERIELHDAHVRLWKKARSGAWFTHRYRTDPEFNLKQRLRAAERKMGKDAWPYRHASSLLKKHVFAGSNSPRLQEIVGWSLSELKAHIERQFKGGMNWRKFLDGEIHIDHIRPRASFKMASIDDVRQCWCLTNLQPLWAADNIKKRDRHDFLL